MFSFLRRHALGLLVGLGAGSATGYFDLHQTDVQAPVLAVLGSVFGLSLVSPKKSWLWALTAGGGVPVAHAWARFTGFQKPYESEGVSPLLALIPAVIAAFAGWWVRKKVSERFESKREMA